MSDQNIWDEVNARYRELSEPLDRNDPCIPESLRNRGKVSLYQVLCEQAVPLKVGDRIRLIGGSAWVAGLVPDGATGTIVEYVPTPTQPQYKSLCVIWDDPKYAAKEGDYYGAPELNFELLIDS